MYLFQMDELSASWQGCGVVLPAHEIRAEAAGERAVKVLAAGWHTHEMPSRSRLERKQNAQ